MAFIKHTTVAENTDGNLLVGCTIRDDHINCYIFSHFVVSLLACLLANQLLFSPDQTPPWATKLNSADYELLCRDGSRAPVSQWNRCHLVRVPFRGIVVGMDVTPSVVFNMLTEGLVRLNIHK